MAVVRIAGLGCCTERVSLLSGLRSSSEVSASVNLRFRVEEIPGCLQ